MRNALFASVAALGLVFAGGAMAHTTNADMAPAADRMNPPSNQGSVAQQTMVRPGHAPGVGLSEPASTVASNITPSDTRSDIAPRLPGSANPGTDETAGEMLRRAQGDLSRHQTGAAQEALERAETRLLDRSTPAGMANTPDQNDVVRTIAQAREALGHNDLARARSLVSQAMGERMPG